jgi:hypothetical protein
LELTHEQRQEVRGAGDGPLRLTDPDTHAEYVVLKADIYDQMRRAVEDVDPSPAGHGVLDIPPVSLGAVIRPVTADDDVLGEMLDGRP